MMIINVLNANFFFVSVSCRESVGLTVRFRFFEGGTNLARNYVMFAKHLEKVDIVATIK